MGAFQAVFTRELQNSECAYKLECEPLIFEADKVVCRCYVAPRDARDTSRREPCMIFRVSDGRQVVQRDGGWIEGGWKLTPIPVLEKTSGA